MNKCLRQGIFRAEMVDLIGSYSNFYILDQLEKEIKRVVGA